MTTRRSPAAQSRSIVALLLVGMGLAGIASAEEAGLSFCDAGLRKGQICCAASCGVCGGCNCGRNAGGASLCCPGAIRAHGFQCMLSSDTGCVIHDHGGDPAADEATRHTSLLAAASRGQRDASDCSEDGEGDEGGASKDEGDEDAAGRDEADEAHAGNDVNDEAHAGKESGNDGTAASSSPERLLVASDAAAHEVPRSRLPRAMPLVLETTAVKTLATPAPSAAPSAPALPGKMCLLPHPLVHRVERTAATTSEFAVEVELQACTEPRSETHCIDDMGACGDGGFCVRVTATERRDCGSGGHIAGLGAVVAGEAGFIGVTCSLDEAFKGDAASPVCALERAYSASHFDVQCGTPTHPMTSSVDFSKLCEDRSVAFDAFCSFERAREFRREGAQAVKTSMRICFETEDDARDYLAKRWLFGVRGERTLGRNADPGFRGCANLCEPFRPSHERFVGEYY